MNEQPTLALLPSRSAMERAFAQKDAAFDGVFYVAVRTTGIFCRPSCPALPKRENVEFLASVKDCLFAGYRPCKRCHPQEANGAPPPWIATLMERVRAQPDRRLEAAALRELGVSPERVRRWFQSHYGMSFAAWCRAQRLSEAFAKLRAGEALDDVALDAGFESHSGFRDAYARTFGEPPGRSRATGECIVTAMLESPLGPLLAGANDEGITLLEFTDRRMLERNLEELRKRFGCPVVPGRHRWLDQLERELAEYFAGRRRAFTVALAPRGTPFQEKVWHELGRIPHAATIAYDELARRIGQPTAQRAVARANGTNRICILIPCHRVIGKDGTLTGYGGGLWRKRLLLELERTGRLPGDTNSAAGKTAASAAI